MLDAVARLPAAFSQHLLLYGSLCVIIAAILIYRHELWTYWTFFYACFLKPVDRGNAADVKALSGQQRALEGFYRTQAEVYDTTRGLLLCGREDMLQLAAAQLKYRQSSPEVKPIWVDVGGGTGYNIEKMNDFVPVDEFFSAVYLVDLSPSLCDVARQRFSRLGWKNVHVVCEDARTFVLDKSADVLETVELGEPGSKHRIKADYISMSYSLSMIPDFYSVIDSIADLLAPSGLITCVDFYVQSAASYSLRNFTGGDHSRHVNVFSRLFWRSWFRLDRVHLDEGRRDYLEHRFGTILNANERNYTLGGIPYYIWLGCQRTATSAGAAQRIDALATESPYLSPVHYAERRAEAASTAEIATRKQLRSKGFEAAILNLAANVPLPATFYQNRRWRLYYDEALPKHAQFGGEYIYAFAWEDPAEDQRLLGIGPDDVVFAITSAGDNVLAYALQRPKSIHAVDLNPAQNHLLELKLAAFAAALPHADVWRLFGEGRHPAFRALLLDRLSPHLSSRAFQFWLDNAGAFASAGGLYETGGTRIAVKLCKWLFRALGRRGAVRELCEAPTLRAQRAIWRTRLRPVVLSRWLSSIVVANEQFLWRALGVPPNQRDMIYEDARTAEARGAAFEPKDAMWRYVVDTLDPVVENTLLKDSNYFYRLCLMGRYSEGCHPAYLSKEAHGTLSQSGAFDGLRVHTDEFVEVLARIRSESVTVAVIMDHMDWFDPEGPQAAEEIRALNKAMKLGGRVLLRSAGLKPWYVAAFSAQGFKCERVAARTSGKCIDRVNMYASTWICTKVAVDPSILVEEELLEAKVAVGVSDPEAVETLEL
ncbi:hypothetical protein BC628DRAFT_1417700 [Trametes gibbosa]|nr:hypothetical protein BC628DRAFT_1417700 [Trametes gibbosa]